MSGLRRTAQSVALLPVVAALVLATAAPAFASATWTKPTDGQVFTTGSTVDLSVDVSSSLNATDLHLSGPGFSDAIVASASAGGAKTLSYSLSTGGRKNGAWTASLSGANTGTRTFYLNFAPATPTNLSAQGTGARDVTFTWTKGSEPDLTGYTLTADDGTVLDSGITTSAAHCSSGSSCSYALYYPNDNPGTHGYKLLARRASGGCSGCGTEVSSAPATASATLNTPPPSPSPTPSPSASPDPAPTSGGAPSDPATPGATGSPAAGGGSTTGGSSTGGSSTGGSSTGGSSTSGSSTGGGTAKGSSTGGSGSTGFQAGPQPSLPSLADQVRAARETFALKFNAFSPSLGIPKLPGLPVLELPTIGGEAPLPTGSYAAQLPYQAQTSTEKVQAKGGFGHPVAAVQNILDSERLAKSLAGALIMLLLAAHVRRFVGSHVSED